MKLLFLDIDGVLNSSDWVRGLKVSKHMSDYKKQKEISEKLDPFNIKNLNFIIEKTGAKIVISSSWRILYSVKELKLILKKNGFLYSDNVIGKTDSGGERRGNEIHRWLVDHDALESKFVILDDDGDMEPHMDRLVKTKWFGKGLEETHSEEVVSMLNEN